MKKNNKLSFAILIGVAGIHTLRINDLSISFSSLSFIDFYEAITTVNIDHLREKLKLYSSTSFICVSIALFINLYNTSNQDKQPQQSKLIVKLPMVLFLLATIFALLTVTAFIAINSIYIMGVVSGSPS